MWQIIHIQTRFVTTHEKKKQDVQAERIFNCRMCGMKNTSKDNLFQHIKSEHTKYKPCKKFTQNSCDLDSECLYNHGKLKTEELMCFKCGLIVEGKSHLLTHIKSVHGNTICQKVKQNQCKFGNSCVYSHSAHITTNQVPQNSTQTQDFHLNSVDLAPPDLNQMVKNQILFLMPKLIQTMIPLMTKEIVTNMNLL